MSSKLSKSGRVIVLGAALSAVGGFAVTSIVGDAFGAPTVLVARRAADDPAGHVRGGNGADDVAGHARRGADDPAGHARRGADDPAGHARRGADDPANHG